MLYFSSIWFMWLMSWSDPTFPFVSASPLAITLYPAAGKLLPLNSHLQRNITWWNGGETLCPEDELRHKHRDRSGQRCHSVCGLASLLRCCCHGIHLLFFFLFLQQHCWGKILKFPRATFNSQSWSKAVIAPKCMFWDVEGIWHCITLLIYNLLDFLHWLEVLFSSFQWMWLISSRDVFIISSFSLGGNWTTRWKPTTILISLSNQLSWTSNAE